MAAIRIRGLRAFLMLSALVLPASGNYAFSAVRFDVVGSPTEVINTGRSEVLGSINLIVRGSGSITGTSTGGQTQIGLVFSRPALQIDNDGASGILVYFSPGFAAANPTLISIENRQVGGQCMGFLTLNLLPGATPAEGDFIRIEGIRGRIDLSTAVAPGTDLYVDLQSINDPAATSFYPESLRVAKSLEGMTAAVLSDVFGFQIRVTESFPRAFVDSDAGDDGVNSNDRVDSAGNALGAPTQSTQVIIQLDGVPGGVSQVIWPPVSTVFSSTGAALRLLDSSFSQGSSRATYSFEAANQTGSSDLVMESFSLYPGFLFVGGDCNTGNLAANVTLGPVAPRMTGCLALSPDAARPRFLEAYELLINWLDPASVVAGSPAFVLKLHGAGFTPDATVRWNGVDLPTVFISRSLLEVSVPADRLALVGSATLIVGSPSATGGTISNPATFTIAPHALSLFFPSLSLARDADEVTGIALVNLGGRTANLTLTAFDRTGAQISGNGITNPATLTLPAWQQLSMVDSEVFGSGLPGSRISGWIRLEGDVARVAGFFLNFDGKLTRLDGADVSGARLASFVLPEASGGTAIRVANPNEDPAAIVFQLMRADGTVRANASRMIQAHGILIGTVTDVFPGTPVDPGDYIRAESSSGVVPYESFGPSSGDSAGLNGQDAGTSYWTLYAPQYVTGGRDWQSMLAVVNLDADPGTVRFRFVADNGTQIGATRTLPIAGRGKISITAQDFFLEAGPVMVQGSVEIVGSGIRLAGSVAFGSRIPGGFFTALPLAPARNLRLTFSQIASDMNFYTGLAIMNPDSAPLRASIKVYDKSGNEIAGKVEDLPAFGRVSKLLTDYFPELAGRQISGGYVIVEAIKNLAAFAVFGAKNLSALSAVPPQIF
jgi:hypothetical protein